MIATSKQALREHLRALHEGAAAREAQSACICRHILNSHEYRNARVIGGYMPLLREADIASILEAALRDGKALVLPLCGDAPHMTLRQVASLKELTPGRYGLLEPSGDAPVVPLDAVDLLLVPLEGVDRQGFRLGKGGGYYDTLLRQADIITIGCALSWQWVDAVPRDAWDQSLTAAADQHGIHYFKR